MRKKTTSFTTIFTCLKSILFALALILSPTLLTIASTADQSKATILIVGDSISAAYGIPEDAGWVALLQEKLEQNHYKFNTINASITGETSSGGVNRIDTLLAQYQPSIVILELGGNDGLRGLSLTAMRKNLQQIIQRSQKQHAQVLLLGMHIPPNYGSRYTAQFHQTYHQLAGEHAVAFEPFFLDGVAQDPQLMQSDGIHPAAAAQPIMLNHVWAVLEPLLH